MVAGAVAMPLLGSGLGLLSGLAGAQSQAEAAKRSARMQGRLGDIGRASRDYERGITSAATKPYEYGGEVGVGTLGQLIGGGFQGDLAMDRALKDTTQSTARMAAAGGKLRSTQTAEQFGRDVSGVTQDAYSRYYGNLQNALNLGVGSGQTLAQAGSSLGQSVAGSLGNLGNQLSQLSGAQGQLQASQYGMMGNVGQQLSNAYMFSQGIN